MLFPHDQCVAYHHLKKQMKLAVVANLVQDPHHLDQSVIVSFSWALFVYSQDQAIVIAIGYTDIRYLPWSTGRGGGANIFYEVSIMSSN